MAIREKATSKSIGLAIRFLRLSKDLTQTQLAELSHLNQSVISGMEAGKSFNIDNLNQIAEAFNLRASQLLSVAENMANAQGAAKGFLESATSLVEALDQGAITELMTRVNDT